MSGTTVVVGFIHSTYPPTPYQPKETNLDALIPVAPPTPTTAEKVDTVANKVQKSTRSSQDARPKRAVPDMDKWGREDPDQYLLTLFPLEL